ncbi:MAG TPA: hypothetical protein VK156_03835 [Candidatus Limnocylindria bacterium]|nr:hypothetical protein [Candidatus Limnocylindria bacterium]
MANLQNKKKGEQSDSKGEFKLQSSDEVIVKHDDLPAKPPEGKKNHPRRRLPLVPEAPREDPGENRKSDQPSREEP